MRPNRILPAVTERERLPLATAELWEGVGYEELSGGAVATRAGLPEEVIGSTFSDLEAAARATLEAPIAVMVGLVGEQFAPDRPDVPAAVNGVAWTAGGFMTAMLDRLRQSSAPSVVYGATAPFVGQREGLRLARLSVRVAEEFGASSSR